MGTSDMADRTWKHAERVIAKMLHGRRIPVSGRQRGDSADIEHPDLAPEVKHGKNVMGWAFVQDAMDQAVKSARGEQVPIVVVHKVYTSYNESLVIMTIDNFIERFLDDDGRLKTTWTQMDRKVNVPRITDPADLFTGINEGEL